VPLDWVVTDIAEKGLKQHAIETQAMPRADLIDPYNHAALPVHRPGREGF